MGRSLKDNLRADLNDYKAALHEKWGVPDGQKLFGHTPAEQVSGTAQRMNAARKPSEKIGDDEVAFLGVMAEQLMAARIGSEVDGLMMAAAHGDSPIERVFAASLWYVAANELPDLHEGRPCILHNSGQHIGTPFIDESLTIEPQAKVGDYRVDFRLTYVHSVPDFDHKDENDIPGVKLRRTAIIVECDGHDFHDKTKEQAARDKSRDRELQAAGYRVFRFTGSELWRNPVSCASQIIDVLTDWGND